MWKKLKFFQIWQNLWFLNITDVGLHVEKFKISPHVLKSEISPNFFSAYPIGDIRDKYEVWFFFGKTERCTKQLERQPKMSYFTMDVDFCGGKINPKILSVDQKLQIWCMSLWWMLTGTNRPERELSTVEKYLSLPKTIAFVKKLKSLI